MTRKSKDDQERDKLNRASRQRMKRVKDEPSERRDEMNRGHLSLDDTGTRANAKQPTRVTKTGCKVAVFFTA